MCFAYELYSAATRTSTDSAYDVRSEGERVGVSYISTWLCRHTERRERDGPTVGIGHTAAPEPPATSIFTWMVVVGLQGPLLE